MLGEEELKDAALLVFANKQDQPGAKGAGDISEALRLGELRDRNWSIMACSAIDGKGINEGMDWLVVSSRQAHTRLLGCRTDGRPNSKLYSRTLSILCMDDLIPHLNKTYGHSLLKHLSLKPKP